MHAENTVVLQFKCQQFARYYIMRINHIFYFQFFTNVYCAISHLFVKTKQKDSCNSIHTHFQTRILIQPESLFCHIFPLFFCFYKNTKSVKNKDICGTNNETTKKKKDTSETIECCHTHCLNMHSHNAIFFVTIKYEQFATHYITQINHVFYFQFCHKHLMQPHTQPKHSQYLHAHSSQSKDEKLTEHTIHIHN